MPVQSARIANNRSSYKPDWEIVAKGSGMSTIPSRTELYEPIFSRLSNRLGGNRLSRRPNLSQNGAMADSRVTPHPLGHSRRVRGRGGKLKVASVNTVSNENRDSRAPKELLNSIEAAVLIVFCAKPSLRLAGGWTENRSSQLKSQYPRSRWACQLYVQAEVLFSAVFD